MNSNRRYRELVAKVRLYFKREQSKKTFLSRFIPAALFKPDFWRWEQDTVATGMGWGMFFAIAPVPMQSLFAASFCVWRRGNIPIAVLAAWLSPPGSLFVIMPLQWYFGFWIQSLLGMSTSGLTYATVKTAMQTGHWRTLWQLVEGMNAWLLIQEFLLGTILSCSILGLFVYALIQGIWSLTVLFKRHPHTHARH